MIIKLYDRYYYEPVSDDGDVNVFVVVVVDVNIFVVVVVDVPNFSSGKLLLLLLLLLLIGTNEYISSSGL